MSLAAFLLSYGGLFALCLAMPKHYRAMCGANALPPRPVLLMTRIAGWLILGLSFVASVDAVGWAFGPVQWVGYLAMSGLVLVFGLPYSPRLVLLLGILAFLAVPLTIILI
ncbi:MAG: DUF3325 domain-containing protein [Nitrospirales bacterium]|nr:DUF3325 domain-containing protein [Nitrospirales bacterium]